jgi:glycosyltransferase involved in cell wall biosynthesis
MSMKTKRIGIVSSYDESCGNASFTRVLVNGLSALPGVKGEGIGLNLRLTGSIDPRLRKAGDDHINELAKQLRTYDAVNLQFEAQLYGHMPNDIYNRFVKLLNANKNTSVTMHSPRLFSAQANDFRVAAIKSAIRLQLRTSAKHYMTSLSANRDAVLNRRLLLEVARKNRPIIVHTKRSEDMIKTLCGASNVHTHPLQIVSRAEQFDAAYMANLKKSLGLAPEVKTIGMFGYISPYKGHSDALRAIARLPKDYVLMVFGRQHPASIRPNESDGFLKQLVSDSADFKLVAKIKDDKDKDKGPPRRALRPLKDFKNRMFFVGELSDDDFKNAAATVDVCWLPYYENGQDGSGIASICFDVAQRVLCSNTFAFDELLRLMPYKNYLRFDIGNDVELATKTLMIMHQPSNQMGVHMPFSIETQSELYARLAGFGVSQSRPQLHQVNGSAQAATSNEMMAARPTANPDLENAAVPASGLVT